MNKLKEILSRIPKKPGVYKMKNSKNDIVYIGKSVNLKSRVSSYFNENTTLNFAKKKMIEQVKDIEIIETRNEVEALVLETNLIKKHKPKYNILMKDDKNLTYIKISSGPIPEIIKTRIKTSDGEYFGPYTSTVNVNNVLTTLKKIFKIRSCKAQFELLPNNKIKMSGLSKQNIPCLDHYIGLCPAPCLLGDNQIEEYKNNIVLLKSFFKGNNKDILNHLEEKMKTKAKNMEFEEAGKIRDEIKSIMELQEKQIARDIINGDNDIIVAYEKYNKVFIGLLEIRNSEINSLTYTKIENLFEEELDIILNQYLQSRYIDSSIENIYIITDQIIKNKAILEYFNSKKIKIETPSIGAKVEIINFTKNNLLNYSYKEELKEIGKKTLTKQTQINILKMLGYEAKNSKEIIFECFDISHLGGTNTVASRSVIINGKSINSKYKKYKLNTIKSGEIDDFKSMEEIIERRIQEGLKLNNLPDLIIIDGGKGQLSSAIKAIEKTLNSQFSILNYLNICSIAKREEEIFIQNKSEPIIFEKGSAELMLFQKIRDEAHRFAINFNREKRNKEMKKNILEEIPGLGPKTRQKLLKLAGSIDKIASISEEELREILNKNQIEELKNYGII